MSRLIFMDIKPGRHIAIQGVRHRVQHVQPGGPLLTLKPESADTTLEMSRNELATLLVLEEAEMLDELEDPEADNAREVTNLSFQPVYRIIDWHGKVFLLRQMMRHAGSSPRSKVFRAAFDGAKSILEDWHHGIGLVDAKTWARWTIYNDLRRWRSLRYSLAAVQRKGLEYCPWTERPPLYVEAESRFHELLREKPGWPTAAYHVELDKRLKRQLAMDRELGHGG